MLRTARTAVSSGSATREINPKRPWIVFLSSRMLIMMVRVDWVQLRHFLCFNISHKNRYWKDVNFHMTLPYDISLACRLRYYQSILLISSLYFPQLAHKNKLFFVSTLSQLLFFVSTLSQLYPYHGTVETPIFNDVKVSK